jgi:GNAT superfamily N-acetyltransferase
MPEPELQTTSRPEAATPAPRRLQPHDREATAQALARAFGDDPLFSYIFPDERMRRNILPVFMRGAIKLAAPHHESFTAEPAPVGGALFLPPGKTKIETIPLLRVMLPDIWRWRPGPLTRFSGIMSEFDGKHHAAFKDAPDAHAHWYLMVLGVDPPRQGEGLGGLLMSDVLKRADSKGQATYLETQKARNVPFYQKHGFEVVEHFNCHGGKGPECWTMLRKPRSA